MVAGGRARFLSSVVILRHHYYHPTDPSSYLYAADHRIRSSRFLCFTVGLSRLVMPELTRQLFRRIELRSPDFRNFPSVIYSALREARYTRETRFRY